MNSRLFSWHRGTFARENGGWMMGNDKEKQEGRDRVSWGRSGAGK